MNLFRCLLVGVGLGASFVNAASAVTISDFTVVSSVTDTNAPGSETTGAVPTSASPFTLQTLTALQTGGSGTVTVRTAGGYLALEPGFGTLGQGSALFMGAGAINLSNTNAFIIDFFSADGAGGDVFLRVIDTFANDSGYLDFTGGGTLGATSASYSILGSTVAGAGVDLASVASVELFFTSGVVANDLAFNSFRTSELAPVPEPASVLLFGLGLCAAGLGFRRKRMA